jgi:hypothetical protein
VQCLFFSLLFLFVGIHAIRKDSFKLFMLSGTIFAVALLTKFYAVFTVIPLAIFYLYCSRRNLRRIFAAAAYFAPALIIVLLWYQIVLGRSLISPFGIDDFKFLNSSGAAPSFFFIGDYLLEGIGALFLAATALSLLVSWGRRDLFAKILPFDLMCLATILIVGGVNTFLAVGMKLNSPYIGPIKYDYQFLPFVSLLAASLVSKGSILFSSIKSKEKLSRVFFSIALFGVIILIFALLLNMSYVHQFSTWPYLLFRVDRIQDIGYSFVNPSPIGKYSFLLGVQYAGFAFVLSGLLWQFKTKLGLMRKGLG